MTSIQLLFAITLPWVSGIILICYLCQLRDDWLPKSVIAGYGYLLGIILVTMIMRVLPLSASAISAMLIILCCYPAISLWRSESKTSHTKLISSFQFNTIKFGWPLIISVSIAALIAIHFYLVAIEIFVKPLFVWDAWATWSVKARTWFELKQIVAFEDRQTWLSQIDQSAHVLDAWHYPDTVPLIQTWVALMIDDWNDSLINLPWLFCLFALGLGFYGQLGLLQIPKLVKLIAFYFLVSLPLINTHVAIAGYADLWLGTAYTFLTLSLIQHLITKSTTQLILTLLLMFCVALIKIEGSVLLFTLIPLWVTKKCSPAVLKSLCAVSVAIVIGFCALLYFYKEIHWSFPYLGNFIFAYHPVWDAVRINYLELPVWHLLCYIASAGLLFAIFSSTLSTDQRKLVLILPVTLICYLFVLFFLTQNYSWARHYSSINRISLHLFPSIMFCLLLIFDKRFHNRHLLSKTA